MIPTSTERVSIIFILLKTFAKFASFLHFYSSNSIVKTPFYNQVLRCQRWWSTEVLSSGEEHEKDGIRYTVIRHVWQ